MRPPDCVDGSLTLVYVETQVVHTTEKKCRSPTVVLLVQVPAAVAYSGIRSDAPRAEGSGPARLSAPRPGLPGRQRTAAAVSPPRTPGRDTRRAARETGGSCRTETSSPG